MPRERPTLRVLGLAAILVAALGLGVLLGIPAIAVAQEGTTTTTVVDDSTDSTVDESTNESTETDRPGRGEHDCGDVADSTDDGSADESSLSDT